MALLDTAIVTMKEMFGISKTEAFSLSEGCYRPSARRARHRFDSATFKGGRFRY